MKPLFVIILRYLKSNTIIDTARPAHRAFLDEQYAKNIFIASGIQASENGGVILAKNINRESLNALLQRDPFYEKHYVEYQIFEFTPTKYSDDFKNFILS